MGEMIGNIAHQWRQPLSVISTSASGMKLQAELGLNIKEKDIVNFSEIIMKQSEYLSNTIENFRNFLKEDKQYSIIKISEILEYTFSLVKASLSNNYIHLISDIDTSLFVNGNKNELSEAFINIITNSKDAIKENINNPDNRFIFITVKENKDKKIEVLFKDNGGGIPNNIINRIFEPYFTSKHQSIGTGLGLSMAEKIIRERHKAQLIVYNEEFEYKKDNYKGACFKIVFDKN